MTDDLVKRLPWRSTKRVPRSTMGYGGGLMLLDGNDACVGYVVTLNKSANINPVEMDDAVCAAVEAADRQAARAAARALMEEGARLALEAAAKLMNVKSVRCESKNVNFAMRCAKEIRALDPAAIVKGAGHDRD